MSQDKVQETSINNTKRDRFIRIAERRVNKLLIDLDHLAKCSNKRNYEYSLSDSKKIFREIERKVREVRIQFQGNTNNKFKFKL